MELTENQKFQYMLLGRYKSDLDYYFGYGNRCEKHLYFHSFDRHIRETIELWKKMPIKPEWLRATELIKYKAMNKTMLIGGKNVSVC